MNGGKLRGSQQRSDAQGIADLNGLVRLLPILHEPGVELKLLQFRMETERDWQVCLYSCAPYCPV
jgi:hypothetical protein